MSGLIGRTPAPPVWDEWNASKPWEGSASPFSNIHSLWASSSEVLSTDRIYPILDSGRTSVCPPPPQTEPVQKSDSKIKALLNACRADSDNGDDDLVLSEEENEGFSEGELGNEVSFSPGVLSEEEKREFIEGELGNEPLFPPEILNQLPTCTDFSNSLQRRLSEGSQQLKPPISPPTPPQIPIHSASDPSEPLALPKTASPNSALRQTVREAIQQDTWHSNPESFQRFVDKITDFILSKTTNRQTLTQKIKVFEEEMSQFLQTLTHDQDKKNALDSAARHHFLLKVFADPNFIQDYLDAEVTASPTKLGDFLFYMEGILTPFLAHPDTAPERSPRLMVLDAIQPILVEKIHVKAAQTRRFNSVEQQVSSYSELITKEIKEYGLTNPSAVEYNYIKCFFTETLCDLLIETNIDSFTNEFIIYGRVEGLISFLKTLRQFVQWPESEFFKDKDPAERGIKRMQWTQKTPFIFTNFNSLTVDIEEETATLLQEEYALSGEFTKDRSPWNPLALLSKTKKLLTRTKILCRLPTFEETLPSLKTVKLAAIERLEKELFPHFKQQKLSRVKTAPHHASSLPLPAPPASPSLPAHPTSLPLSMTNLSSSASFLSQDPVACTDLPAPTAAVIPEAPSPTMITPPLIPKGHPHVSYVHLAFPDMREGLEKEGALQGLPQRVQKDIVRHLKYLSLHDADYAPVEVQVYAFFQSQVASKHLPHVGPIYEEHLKTKITPLQQEATSTQGEEILDDFYSGEAGKNYAQFLKKLEAWVKRVGPLQNGRLYEFALAQAEAAGVKIEDRERWAEENCCKGPFVHLTFQAVERWLHTEIS